jgi:hypothetical protein
LNELFVACRIFPTLKKAASALLLPVEDEPAALKDLEQFDRIARRWTEGSWGSCTCSFICCWNASCSITSTNLADYHNPTSARNAPSEISRDFWRLPGAITGKVEKLTSLADTAIQITSWKRIKPDGDQERLQCVEFTPL